MTKEEKINYIISEYPKGRSMTDLSKETGINVGSVHYYLKKNKIESRTVSQGVNMKLSHKDEISLSDKNKSILIGNLLGDGSLRRLAKRPYYSHTDKNKEYLEWLKEEFVKDGITFGDVYRTKNGCYTIQSHAFSVFNQYYDKFYINRERVFPLDIILTPETLRQWYISDGSVATHGGRNISKIMKSREDANVVAGKIEDIIGKGVTYNSGRFYIPKRLVSNFLEYMGRPPTNCYKYKWR